MLHDEVSEKSINSKETPLACEVLESAFNKMHYL